MYIYTNIYIYKYIYIYSIPHEQHAVKKTSISLYISFSEAYLQLARNGPTCAGMSGTREGYQQICYK